MSSSNRRRGLGGWTGARLPVVELIGTPGAGKTTLAGDILPLLRERGWAPVTIVDAAREHARRTPAGRLVTRYTSGAIQRLLLWWLFYGLGSLHALAFVIEQPRLTRLVLRTQFRRPIRITRRLHICFWFFQLAGRQRFLSMTADDGEVLVVDDGFLHRAVHIYASHTEQPSAQRIMQYVDLLPEPAVVVHVRCDEATCEQRVRRRGPWRHSRRLTVAELSRYLVRSDRVVGVATRRARERGWFVADVDNGPGTAKAPATDLVRALDRAFPVSSCSSDRQTSVTA
jgi:broad-specificity NMP kinase